MKRNKQEGLRLTVRAARRQSGVSWSGLPGCLCLLAGLTRLLTAAFPSIPAPWWALFLGEAALCLLLFALYGGRLGGLILPVGCLLTAAACLCALSPFLGGLRLLGNDFLAFLTAKTGKIHLDFEAEPGGSALLTAAVAAGLAALLCSRAAARGQLILLLPVLLPALAAGLFGLFPVDWGWAPLFAGTLLLLARRTAESGVCAPFARGTAGQLALLLFAALCAAGLGYLLRNLPDTALLQSVRTRWHESRYDSETNSMPEGRLADLGPWEKSDAAALRLTMEEPEKLYLRGHVYETYTGTAWEPLAAATRATSADLFYWLHASGFFGQSQIGLAAGYTAAIAPQTMTIETLSACRETAYLPYALCGSEGLDSLLIGDAGAEAWGTETVSCLTGSVPDWYAVQQALSAAQTRSNVSGYLALEQAYEDDVQAQDLQMTEDSWAVLDRQLGDDGSAKTLSEIRALIRDYLGEHLTYDETVTTGSGDGDFLRYVLEGSGSGYSVQYATAAVLMLRYYGVPARYVEGYFLSADDAAALQSGESVTLTEENAHAWAEYYLPGVGFVPFEVTPGYMDDEETELGGASGTEATYQNTLQYARVQQPEETETQQQSRTAYRPGPLLLLLLFLLLAAAMVTAAVRRGRLKRALRRIGRAAPREAISLRYGYAALLLRRGGIDPLPGAETAALLNQEALFSRRAMTEDQRRQMDDYAAGVLAACRKHWNVLQRLRYRWIDCLY
ncbi:MAG: transglutaminase-like domain-containing protein [Oscillospiraceae bacterium]|nr:transglutaminase-like domain-containing protein [Oscillospiraceae bacterium]